MKPRISLFAALLIPAAFTAGWWFRGRTEDTRLSKIEERFTRQAEEAEAVAHALNAATFINSIYQTVETSSAEEQSIRKRNWLITEVLYLARAEPFKSENQDETFLMHANNAMDLLGVNDLTQFNAEVHATRLVDSVKAIFADSANAEHELAVDFVRRTFAYRKSQPSYPARLWIMAINQRDSGLLASAFSTKLRKETSDWDERLDTYASRLNESFSNAKPNEFGFSFSVGINSGEVRILWKDREYRSMKIVLEKNEWKLDEF